MSAIDSSVLQLTPDFGVPQWLAASGEPMPGAALAASGPAWTLLFLFQHACRGCHLQGFPALLQLVEGLRRLPVRVRAVQTVFEEFELNTHERLSENQARYGLLIPFGHDDGSGAGSALLKRLGAGGTPWFVLIDPLGEVVHSHFTIEPARAIAYLEKAIAMTDTRVSPNWQDVLHWARHGNPSPPKRIEFSEAEWRQRLTPEEYRVLRDKGTERPFSSAACTLFEPGRQLCGGCGTPLFDAQTKFDSQSGWPSFTAPLTPGVVAYVDDSSHGMQRIEAVCGVCDGHLGHVFPDGPPPTGLRYCINALSLHKEEESVDTTTETAVLAGGCFWGMQELIRELPGVLRTRVGYTGGDVPNATYRNHGSHAEGIEIVFDPAVFSYRQLLEFFFQIHDPSTPNRQGNDRGMSYRSGIYTLEERQREIAQQAIADVEASGRWPGKVVTEVKPAGAFWEAEPEHQDYLQRYPDGYTCHWVRPEWTLG